MTTTDMSALDTEAAAIYDQIDAIVSTTKFNGVDLLGFSAKIHQVTVADNLSLIHI